MLFKVDICAFAIITKLHIILYVLLEYTLTYCVMSHERIQLSDGIPEEIYNNIISSKWTLFIRSLSFCSPFSDVEVNFEQIVLINIKSGIVLKEDLGTF